MRPDFVNAAAESVRDSHDCLLWQGVFRVWIHNGKLTAPERSRPLETEVQDPDILRATRRNDRIGLADVEITTIFDRPHIVKDGFPPTHNGIFILEVVDLSRALDQGSGLRNLFWLDPRVKSSQFPREVLRSSGQVYAIRFVQLDRGAKS